MGRRSDDVVDIEVEEVTKKEWRGGLGEEARVKYRHREGTR